MVITLRNMVSRLAFLRKAVTRSSGFSRVSSEGIFVSTRYPSQVDIPPSIPVTLKVEIKTSKRRKEFNHVLGHRGSRLLCRRSVGCFFKQIGSKGLHVEPLRGGLPGELFLSFRLDVKSDGHGWPPCPIMQHAP